MRSVHVSSTTFHDGTTEQSLTPDDLLQMFGRAGRRGLDERGYVITSRESPTLADARAAKLRRSSRLSWPLFLRVMRHAALAGTNPFTTARDFAQKLFSKSPPSSAWKKHKNLPWRTNRCALFGLKATRRELLNSEGAWEKHRKPEPQTKPLYEAWLALEGYRGPALANARFVQSLPPSSGRICKLSRTDGASIYGKEIALGTPSAEGITPTHALRKLLRIPKDIEVLTREKVQDVALPRLAKLFEGAQLVDDLADKENLVWAQFGFSTREVGCLCDSHGRWIAQPMLRTVERTVETEIRDEAAFRDERRGQERRDMRGGRLG